MSIKRGVGSIARTHARNYIQTKADARFQEAVRPYQQQGLNALGVDSFEVKLYHRVNSTSMCTCKAVDKTEQHKSTGRSPIQKEALAEFEVVHDTPLFGSRYVTAHSDEHSQNTMSEVDEVDAVDGPVVNQLFASSAECGICYKCGTVPGYELYGHQRSVFTTHNLENVYGYWQNRSSAPNTLEQQDPEQGFVEFVVDVPYFFRSVSFSVRNNTQVLTDEVLYDVLGNPLSLAHFANSAGSRLAFRVRAAVFTHAVLEFDLGVDPVRANLSQTSKQSDWSMFDTSSNINIILPATIREISTSDVVYVPERNLTLKVGDTPFLRTARGAALDWSVGTRVLQPQESLKLVARTFPIA